MKILAIETSCDETAISIIECKGSAKKPVFDLLSNVVLSQIAVHQPFGGVVPNLAQREHQKNLVPILTTALRDAGSLKKKSPQKISLTQSRTKSELYSGTTRPHLKNFSGDSFSETLSREPVLLAALEKFLKKYEAPDIDAIAVTYGPGLEPALWVGINFAKALAAIWKKPLYPVNHLEGHVYAGFLPPEKEFADFNFPNAKDIFPALALIVSGGHTELVLVKGHDKYMKLGETRDDAAGEAFDKVAKMLSLGYPGGPLISKVAENGNPSAIDFPRPMINSKDFDFSFSGLKTSVLYYIREKRTNLSKDKINTDENSRRGRAVAEYNSDLVRDGVKEFSDALILSGKADIAASFEQAVIDVLVLKTANALKKYKIKSLVVGGGVSANKKLRDSLKYMIKLFPDTKLYLSPMWLTGDNASMIAVAGYFNSQKKKNLSARAISALKAQGNLDL